MSFTIASMTVDDAERCAELERALFAGDGPWSAQAFVSELAGSHNHYFVAREPSGHVLGYAGIALLGAPPDVEAEVHTIGTDPGAQRRGIGGALLDALLTLADEHGAAVFLEVRTDNEPAIALYRREGFEIVGTRKKYYQPSGADAYTMRRSAAGVRENEEQQA
ncbi:ribosomal protein S18-alanine N-acetyltransferase [Rhodococcus sp. ARC_M6]|uniref:ribosomal protein S18-alanine N-acetyltransferase n=1 Tax=Rhodococcus sp. ARC_M6 TaxID=2928852 RepID=UPI001FB4E3DE|nr:ribosomal protein S18-alanine N-acetyltransferase [Rhodococcus sp. ARC_M6]MCJ0905103.1 ribosomal protein S18-alanine N-acetyltransferase [Rhodococcus sp. ARC_M6]